MVDLYATEPTGTDLYAAPTTAMQPPTSLLGALGTIGKTLGGELYGATQQVMPFDPSQVATPGLAEVQRRVPGFAPEGASLGAVLGQDPRFQKGERLAGPLLTAMGLVGGGGEAGLRGLKFIGKRAPKLADVEGMAQQIRNNLWKGSIEDATESTAKDVNTGYKGRIEESSGNYKPVMDKYGDDLIYSATLPKKSYYNLPNHILDDLTPGGKRLAKDFERDPTLKNAHYLQSQLGRDTALKRGWNASQADNRVADKLEEAREAIKNDIGMFLKRADKSGDALDQYQYATDFHRENVAPYYKLSGISKIAKGKIINPGNLARLLKNPEPETMQVFRDLPSETKGKVIFHQLGRVGARKSAEATVNAADKLDEQGLARYATPRFKDQIEQLRNAIRKNEGLKTARDVFRKRAKTALKYGGVGLGLTYAGHKLRETLGLGG